jgi:hypothetical protein
VPPKISPESSERNDQLILRESIIASPGLQLDFGGMGL